MSFPKTFWALGRFVKTSSQPWGRSASRLEIPERRRKNSWNQPLRTRWTKTHIFLSWWHGAWTVNLLNLCPMGLIGKGFLAIERASKLIVIFVFLTMRRHYLFQHWNSFRVLWFAPTLRLNDHVFPKGGPDKYLSSIYDTQAQHNAIEITDDHDISSQCWNFYYVHTVPLSFSYRWRSSTSQNGLSSLFRQTPGVCHCDGAVIKLLAILDRFVPCSFREVSLRLKCRWSTILPAVATSVESRFWMFRLFRTGTRVEDLRVDVLWRVSWLLTVLQFLQPERQKVFPLQADDRPRSSWDGKDLSLPGSQRIFGCQIWGTSFHHWRSFFGCQVHGIFDLHFGLLFIQIAGRWEPPSAFQRWILQRMETICHGFDRVAGNTWTRPDWCDSASHQGHPSVAKFLKFDHRVVFRSVMSILEQYRWLKMKQFLLTLNWLADCAVMVMEATFATVHCAFTAYKDVRAQVYANRGLAIRLFKASVHFVLCCVSSSGV